MIFFFWKLGCCGLITVGSEQSTSNINSLLQNEKKILPWFINLKSILNNIGYIPCVNNSLWSTYMARRANAEPSEAICFVFSFYSRAVKFYMRLVRYKCQFCSSWHLYMF